MIRRAVLLLFILVSLAAYISLGYFTERTNFPRLIGLYGLLFGLYAVILTDRTHCRQSLPVLLTSAFVFRLVFLLALPSLSDDYFRFVWDGRLLAHGINPYLSLPRDIVHTTQAAQAGLSGELFRQLNSPDYYTVYPPLNQAIFTIAARLFPDNVTGSVVVMRLFILLAEAGNVLLLLSLTRRLGLYPGCVAGYALNPLVIVELTGNLHFEALMIFFLLLAVHLLLKTSPTDDAVTTWPLLLSAGSLALAVNIKLLPLIFLPSVALRWGLRRGLLYGSVVGLLTLAFFLPFLRVDLLQKMGSSVDLYFHKFEFNASLYYLTRWLGYRLVGFNIIGVAGTLLSLLTLGGVFLIAFRQSGKNSPFTTWLFSLTLYYSLATTVHPWYLTTLVALSVCTPYRYALVWSGLATLSYAAYHHAAYQENLLLVFLEYFFAFGCLIYELVYGRNRAQAIVL